MNSVEKTAPSASFLRDAALLLDAAGKMHDRDIRNDTLKSAQAIVEITAKRIALIREQL